MLLTFIQSVEKANEVLSQIFLEIKLVLGYILNIFGVHRLVPIYLVFVGEEVSLVIGL